MRTAEFGYNFIVYTMCLEKFVVICILLTVSVNTAISIFLISSEATQLGTLNSDFTFKVHLH